MAASLFHGPGADGASDGAVGCMTSGGTESILVAVQNYRDRARRARPWVCSPQIVAPTTIHPAFDKAAHYFNVKLVKAAIGDDLRADVRRMASNINRNTIALLGSAPQYPHGVVDPIEELSVLALNKKLPLHVDACVGGFILPWLEKLGRQVPAWDFRLPGVTAISADLHKYGYTGKGASVLMWRSMDAMKHQFFVQADYPGGVYISPSLLGTRPGGPIAAAWAALNTLGEDGYLALATKAVEAADRIRAGVRAIPGLLVLGDSSSTIVAWGAAAGGPDPFAIADRLEARGWAIDRTQHPSGVHLTVTANHLQIVDEYLADVRAAAAEVRSNPSLSKSGNAALYGLMAKVPVRGFVDMTVRKMMEGMYAPGVVVPDLQKSASGGGFVDRMVDRYQSQISDVFDQVDRARQKAGAFAKKLGR